LNSESKVIEYLRARAHTQGPFNDGRKIALILPGGLMSGVIGAGAVTAFEELGLTNAFDVVYCASAGFANASYFLSGNTALGSEVYWDEISGKKFVNFSKFWKPFNFEKVVRAIKINKPLLYQKLYSTDTELLVRLRNNRIIKYVNIKSFPEKDYFKLLKAAISFPYLSRGAQIEGLRFYDGGRIMRDACREYVEDALRDGATDIVIPYNHFHQVIVLNSGNILEIIPEQLVSIFETKPEVLKTVHGAMRNQVLNMFGK
jgi:predicted patatin/cPLA2 family phospholipase